MPSEPEVFEILQEIKNKKISLHDLYNKYKTNIDKYNGKYNAIPTIVNSVFNETSIDEILQKTENTVLHGLPVVVKDSILTKGIKTTCGADEYADFIPDKNANCITEILNAGGIITGKSNTPKLTLDIQTHNELFGITKNPYNPQLTAGGSSGGSAAAIRLGMTDFALGSDMAGSLRIPAAYCGIKSMKPTYGSINSAGHIPPEPKRSFAGFEITIGPMSSTVRGLELLFQVLSNSPMSGFPKIPTHPRQMREVADIELKVSPQLKDKFVSSDVEMGISNFISNLDEYNVNYEIDQPELNYEQIHQTHRTFYHTLMNSLEKESPSSPVPSQLANAIEIRNKYAEVLEQFMGDSVWILPVSRIQPFKHNIQHNDFNIDGRNFRYWDCIDYTMPLSVLGSPVIVIPVGMVNNLPFGIQIVGKRWQDYELLSVAKSLENMFGENVKPPKINDS